MATRRNPACTRSWTRLRNALHRVIVLRQGSIGEVATRTQELLENATKESDPAFLGIGHTTVGYLVAKEIEIDMIEDVLCSLAKDHGYQL